jgi:hypothetical protein
MDLSGFAFQPFQRQQRQVAETVPAAPRFDDEDSVLVGIGAAYAVSVLVTLTPH